MPIKPRPRVFVGFQCSRCTPPYRRSSAIGFSLKRLRPIPPKPPTCIMCGSKMERQAGRGTYQALLSSDWDTTVNRSRVRQMFSAMLGRG